MLSGDSLPQKQQAIQLEDEGAIPISPHQLILKEVSAKTASILNERWHSRLPKIHWSNIVRNTHYVCYGIYFNGEVVAVAIWSSPVAQNRFLDGKQMLELRRLAISNKCPKNTASRIISVMIKLIKRKFPEIKRLISYQDMKVHKGTIYSASNWKRATQTKYISWTTLKRKRNMDQAKASKIRWEYLLGR